VSNHRYEELNRWKWFAHLNSGSGLWYAERNLLGQGQKRIGMHQQILGIRGIDHGDNNTLNNCDYNIRAANQSQNIANTRKHTDACSSRYKGVSFMRGARKWRAYIMLNYRQTHLGCFEDEQDAARAYDAAAVKYFGEFARLNFPIWLPDCEDAKEVALYLATKHDGPNGARERWARGEDHLKAKLIWMQVCLIRLCGFVGMTRRYLAERFRINHRTVSEILLGKTWKPTPEMEADLAAMYEQSA